MKGKGEMERYAQLNAEFQRIQRIARRDKKALSIIINKLIKFSKKESLLK